MKKRAIALGLLQVVVALGAIPAGVSLITQPDGCDLGMSLSLLSQSPFTDFLLPGIFLLVIHGLCNAIGAYLSFSGHHARGILGFILGILLILWILVQAYYVGFSSFLQPLFFLIGLVEIYLGFGILRHVSRVRAGNEKGVYRK